jgi:hypothetical protein
MLTTGIARGYYFAVPVGTEKKSSGVSFLNTKEFSFSVLFAMFVD